jgi:hypothetical protein
VQEFSGSASSSLLIVVFLPAKHTIQRCVRVMNVDASVLEAKVDLALYKLTKWRRVSSI